MNYEQLQNEGLFLGEEDFHHNGIYAGTYYYYLFGGNVYCRKEPTNAFTYDGPNRTFMLIPDAKEAIEKYKESYFVEQIGEDAYRVLFEHLTKDEYSTDIVEMIERMGGPTKFSEAFDIPLRTVQHWKSESRRAPEYVVKLIKEKMERMGK